MSILAPTPAERLVDAAGRPYFLWDDDMSLQTFREKLDDADPDVRAYFIGKLMRQAKPDDVFSFITLRDIETMWARVERYLGASRDFWYWLMERWSVATNDRR